MPREDVQSFLDELHADPDYKVYERLAELAAVIAENIETRREGKSLTQTQLAKEMGTHQSRVSLLEDPTYAGYTLETLVRLELALDCPIVDFFCDVKKDYVTCSLAETKVEARVEATETDNTAYTATETFNRQAA